MLLSAVARVSSRAEGKPASGALGHPGAASFQALPTMRRLLSSLLTRENLLALVLCLMALAIVVMSAESSPTWIYQGF